MSESPHLGMPYLQPAQAQKHVTMNEALRVLDALTQISVLDRDLAAPPATPDEGDRYIVASSASGAWEGRSTEIAVWRDGAWAFHAPKPGWLCWVVDDEALVVWDGATWTAAVAGSGGSGGGGSGEFETVGVNATADATNRLAVSGPATLLNHAGAGHQLKLNKAAAGDTASLLFQTGFSGRAEMGTAGDDDFRFKVSADGVAWSEAIVIDAGTGEVAFPNTTLAGGAPSVNAAAFYSGGATVCASGAWTTLADWVALRSDLGSASYASATGRVTIASATAGWWNLSAAFGPTGGTSDCGTRIVRNGSTILAFARIAAGASQTDTRVVFCACAAYLAAGDTIEVQGFHMRGANALSTGQTTVFSMIRAGLP
jgi:hypothetical protein